MSYALLGLGAIDPEIVRPATCRDAAASGGVSYCIGYEQSCPNPDTCCPPETWYTNVYREIIGKKSARAIAEQKVRRAERVLFEKIGDELAIERHAHDQSATIPEGLLARIWQSFHLFGQCFPAEAWKWDPDDVKAELECGDVTYGSWDEIPTYYPAHRIAGLEDLAGVKLGASFVAQLRAEGLYRDPGPLYSPGPGADPIPGAKPPAALKRALEEAGSVIEAVPGSRPGDIVDPTYAADRGSGGGARQPTMAELVTILPNRQIAPGPWLTSFVAFFQRRGRPGMTAGPSAGSPFTPKPPPKLVPREGSSVGPTPGPSPSTRPVLLAAGALIAGIGAYALVRAIKR